MQLRRMADFLDPIAGLLQMLQHQHLDSRLRQVQMTGWSKIPPTNDANNEGHSVTYSYFVDLSCFL